VIFKWTSVVRRYVGSVAGISLAIVLAAKPPTWNTGSEQYGSVY
jgi:hypothetical protein